MIDRRRLAAIALSAILAACAFGGGGKLRESSPGIVKGSGPSPAEAMKVVEPGRSSRTQVAQALGAANVIAFPSGWEVWVYRWPDAHATTRGATEFVILVDPAGTVQKTRLRMGGPLV